MVIGRRDQGAQAPRPAFRPCRRSVEGGRVGVQDVRGPPQAGEVTAFPQHGRLRPPVLTPPGEVAAALAALPCVVACAGATTPISRITRFLEMLRLDPGDVEVPPAPVPDEPLPPGLDEAEPIAERLEQSLGVPRVGQGLAVDRRLLTPPPRPSPGAGGGPPTTRAGVLRGLLRLRLPASASSPAPSRPRGTRPGRSCPRGPAVGRGTGRAPPCTPATPSGARIARHTLGLVAASLSNAMKTSGPWGDPPATRGGCRPPVLVRPAPHPDAQDDQHAEAFRGPGVALLLPLDDVEGDLRVAEPGGAARGDVRNAPPPTGRRYFFGLPARSTRGTSGRYT